VCITCDKKEIAAVCERLVAPRRGCSVVSSKDEADLLIADNQDIISAFVTIGKYGMFVRRGRLYRPLPEGAYLATLRDIYGEAQEFNVRMEMIELRVHLAATVSG